MSEIERAIRKAVGLADGCELMALSFSFPTQEIAAALAGGLFVQDARAILGDCDVGQGRIAEHLSALDSLEGVDPCELFERLRRGHTTLFLAPGAHALVFPYETAFRARAGGSREIPSLFLTPTANDVERHMREAGIVPKDIRKEPVDSIWNEFSFLSFLYGSMAAAMHEGRDDDVRLWREHIAGFWNEHGSEWLPVFMEQTQTAASDVLGGELYVAFAEIGRLVLEVIAADARAFSGSAES